MNILIISGLILLLLAFLIPAMIYIAEKNKIRNPSYTEGLPLFVICAVTIWLEIAIFYGLHMLSIGVNEWIGAPYWLTWWIGFFFGFVELAILILAFSLGLINAIYDP